MRARERERVREREREMQSRACVEQGDTRNRIRTLILKLVNPLESLEDRIAIHTVYKYEYFHVHP